MRLYPLAMRISLLIAPTLLALSTLVIANEKEDREVSIRLHAEGTESDGPSFVAPIELAEPAKKTFIRKVPIVSERSIAAIYPFAGDSGSLGCTFRLDANGRQLVEEFTTSSRDAMVVALINGRIASALRVERRISDGVITIPTGFTPEEILILQSKHPTIGKEKEFKKQQKEALASLKKAEKARKQTEKKKSESKPAP